MTRRDFSLRVGALGRTPFLSGCRQAGIDKNPNPPKRGRLARVESSPGLAGDCAKIPDHAVHYMIKNLCAIPCGVVPR
jgi:hypothetical protein